MKRSVGELSAMMQLLDEALDLPEASRLTWVDTLPDDYAALRPSLRALLSVSVAHETRDVAQLEQRIARIVHDEIPAQDQPALRPGIRIGPYALDRELGQGGMGSVWLAHRADGAFQRLVALKLPHVTWMGDLAARLARERDILSTLQHENIARFLDAGVDQAGRPFLAMEYVEGEPIDVYCAAQKLNVRERLRLVLGVAKAVAHAHSKLIVHRDLKPSNILVSRDGGVRLLDFGVAALIDEKAARQSRLTQFAGRVLTVDYASPEQIGGESIGTATDVYSLAVVAYELLTGARPYRLKRGTTAELEQAIAEVEPRPASDSVSDPALKRQLRGDLDAVLNRAMKKKPGERYATIAAFGDDLERHLNDVPVIARPDSVVYRARKFVARHALEVSAAGVILVVVLAGSAVALWQAHAARVEATRSKATKDFLVEIFRSNDVRIASDKPHADRTIKEVLDAAVNRIEEQFAGQTDMQLELLGLTATIYENQQDMDRYHALQARRMQIAKAAYGPSHPLVIEGLLQESDAACSHLDFETAAKLLTEADMALVQSGHDGGEQRADWLRIKARMLHRTASNQNEADQLLDQAIALYRKNKSKSSGYADAVNMSARVHAEQGNLAVAMPLMEEAIRVAEGAPDRDDALLSGFVLNLARQQEALGDLATASATYRRAQELARRTFGVHHRNYWMALAWHAQLLHRRGDRAAAQRLFAEMLKNVTSAPGDYDGDGARGVYAECLAAEGNALAAIPLLETMYQTVQKSAAYDFEVRETARTLGDAYDHVGRTADARDKLWAAHEELLAKDPPGSRWVLRARERWGRFLLDHSRPGSADFGAAEVEFQEVLAHQGKRTFTFIALAHAGLARIAAARGDRAAALAESQRALATLADVQNLYDLRIQPQIWLVHSAVLLLNGDKAGAREWAEKARAASLRYDDPSSSAIVQANAAVARATTGRAGI